VLLTHFKHLPTKISS